MLITEGATSTVFPEYNLTPGVSIETPDNLYVRGLGPEGASRRSDQPGPVRLRPERTGGLLQSGASDARRRRGGVGGGRGGTATCRAFQTCSPTPCRRADDARWSVERAVTAVWDPDAEAGVGVAEHRPAAAEPGEDAPQAGGRGGGRGGGAAPNPATLPRVLLSFPTDPNDLLLVGTAGRRRDARRPRRRDRLAGRQGARGDVRQPPLLAMADAGQLLPRLQRDPELERFRRRESPREGGDGGAIRFEKFGRFERFQGSSNPRTLRTFQPLPRPSAEGGESRRQPGRGRAARATRAQEWA